MTLVEELRNKKSRDNRELFDRAADKIEELEAKLINDNPRRLDLPCTIGDTVYSIGRFAYPRAFKVTSITYRKMQGKLVLEFLAKDKKDPILDIGDTIYFTDKYLGKSIFLRLQDAIAALPKKEEWMITVADYTKTLSPEELKRKVILRDSWNDVITEGSLDRMIKNGRLKPDDYIDLRKTNEREVYFA
ncbi:MAG: hypothetical protein IJZ42_13230 [Lachnospiraceae bacterium]|nr:hypothetical protein [Lachnospiraceae bacterium]